MDTLALLDADGLIDTVGAGRAVAELAAAGRTPMTVAVDGQILGMVAVADQVHPDAAAMIDQLHRTGVDKVVMLAGDTLLVAEAIGRLTGIDEVHAALLQRTSSTP